MSVVSAAQSEMKLANFSDSEIASMTTILQTFFNEWDSGGAVAVMAPVLQRLIAGKPLSPLTGTDAEWVEVGEGIWQNLRCSSVFKDKDGRCYNIDENGRPTITFPYWPERAVVDMPIMEVASP